MKKEILNLLYSQQKVMTTLEIIEFMKINKTDKIVSAVSMALNNLCKLGYCKSITIKGIKGKFYGLSIWFVNNELLDKHKTDFLMSI